MEVLSIDPDNNWITAIISGRWCQAKVFDDPSVHGINGGRISILVIGKTSRRNPNQDFFKQMDFNYSRGLDFDNLPPETLRSIIDELESITLIEEARLMRGN